MNTKYKICSKCKINKSIIEFNKQKSAKDGYQFSCKVCAKQYDKQWRIANADKLKKYAKQYNLDNVDKIKQSKKKYRIVNADKLKQYRIANADKSKKYAKQYNLDNVDKIKQSKKQYGKQWRIANADKLKQRNKQFRIDNIDKIKQQRKKYLQSEHGKLVNKAAQHRHRALIKNNTPSGKHFTTDDIKLKFKFQKGKCVYCQTSIKDYYEIDHIIPLVKGGSNEASNIQLLCKKCNSMGGKGVKLPHDFAKQHGMLF